MVASGSEKNKMATAKIQTQGFKTAFHKPMGDVTAATSVMYTVYGQNLMQYWVPDWAWVIFFCKASGSGMFFSMYLL